MLMVELESEGILENEDVEICSNLTSMIGLGGGIRGVVAVHCPASVAKSITGSFLGMDKHELDEDVRDAIGEIANMVAGNLKVSFAKTDIMVELAIPTSIVGKGFAVTGMADAARYVAPLKMNGNVFWVELFLNKT